MVALRPWSHGDLEILRATVGSRAIMEHLGGPETPEQIAQRHERYLALSDPRSGGMFTIAFGAGGEVAGTIGFWEAIWRGVSIYETGWMVLERYARNGVASAAAIAIVRRAREQRHHRFLHAFPSVANVASNRVCAKAGFTNCGECDFEYPQGCFMRSNDWRIDLEAGC